MNNEYEDELEFSRERRSRSRKKPGSENFAQNGRARTSDRMDIPKSASEKGERRTPKFREPEPPRQAPRKAKNKRRRRIITMIAAECFALLLIFTYAFFAKRWNMIQRHEFQQDSIKNEELTVEDLTKMKGYWMIAVFGVDSRGSNVGKGTNADVNMICCINRETGEIKLVSVFRDSYLNIDDKGTYNKINAAYANGGPEQAVKALNKNLDLNITDYVTFNWKAVADAINILGGVDIELSKAEHAYINSFITETVKVTGVYSQHIKKAGMNHLDGVQAVAYGRLRLMDTDFARTERQRKVIAQAFEKCKKADFAVLNQLLELILPQVATSIDLSDLTNVALSVTKYHMGESIGFPMARDDANMGKRGACVIPTTLESNVIELHKFLFGEEDLYEPTATVKKISATISEHTGKYKAGKSVGHVSTEGYLPKETTAAVVTTTEETSSTEESENTSESTPYETDEHGNIIDPPEDLDPSAHSSSAVDGSTEDGSSSVPHSSSAGGNRPNSPTDLPDPDESSGPGVRPTQPPEESSPVESSAHETTAADHPGGPNSPSGSTTSAQTPGGGTSQLPGETVTVPAPPQPTNSSPQPSSTAAPFPGSNESNTPGGNTPGGNIQDGPGA
ncbi:MAG: LCP family protein [Clostridiaceae bacterium]|nr:LCP family protein [Clostridiaceae bacterium]